MEAAFLLLLFITEAALTVYTCLDGRGKDKWYIRRLFVRIIEIVSLLLFVILPGVNAGSRFALCGILLGIRLILAFIVWLCKKGGADGKLGTAGLIFRLLGSMILMTLTMIPAFLFTGYDGLETTGEYDVKYTQAILTDSSRTETFEQDGSCREVPVYIYYPDTENGSFPLVLFSHGAFGYYQSNSSTYMELASNGYVVISMDHPYHSFFTKDTAGNTIIADRNFIGEIQKINGDSLREDETIAMGSEWISLRTADISFVLDSVKEAAESGVLTGEWNISQPSGSEEILRALSLVNRDKIGLMGHSLGGASAVSLGRTRDDIDAVIDLDGTMIGERIAFENGKYVFIDEPYPVPLLSVDNEEHHFSSEEEGEDYVNVFVLKNAVDGHCTWFRGSGHMNFTDLPLFSPPLASLLGTGSIDSESCVRQMNQIVLQFCDCYLKDTGEFVLQECYE